MPPSLTEIRGATPDDADRLSPLFTQLGYPTGVPLIESRLRSLDPRTTVLVAERDSTLLGFVAVSVYPAFIVEEAVILALVVEEAVRNEGVGATLLRAAENWAAERGAATIVVRSNVMREDAHRFYEREGYRRKKSQHIFEKVPLHNAEGSVMNSAERFQKH
jgi:GNAT superfamily N-acetyltransferase